MVIHAIEKLSERPLKYTLDQLVNFRLGGWKANEWVFLPMRDFAFLRDQIEVERSNHYHGLHGMSVIIVCDENTSNDAYAEGDKVLKAGVLNLGIWHIKLPHIAEIVFHNHRYQTPRVMPIDAVWADSVKKLSEASR